MFSGPDSAGTSTRRTSWVTLVAAVMLVVAGSGAEQTARAQTQTLATRFVGDDFTCYEGGVAIPVVIILEEPPPGTGIVQPALGEFAPVGWTISNVTTSGPIGDEDPPCNATGDSLQCVFGSWPVGGIVVTYDVTPPGAESGTQCWGVTNPRLSDFNTFIQANLLDPVCLHAADGVCDPDVDPTINENSCSCPADCLAGDTDGDNDVDFVEVGAFLACFTGPKEAPGFPGLGSGCVTFDFDCDGDVDFVDVGAFLAAFTGPL